MSSTYSSFSKMVVPSGPTVLFFGDSYIRWQGEFSNRRVKIPTMKQHWFGVEGMTACGSGEKLEDAMMAALRLDADIVVICLGGNDIFPNCTLNSIAKALMRMRDGFTAAGASAVFVTGIIHRLACGGMAVAGYQRVRRLVNDILRSRFGKMYIPLPNISRAVDLLEDGVHLNDTGNLKLMKILRVALSTCPRLCST